MQSSRVNLNGKQMTMIGHPPQILTEGSKKHQVLTPMNARMQRNVEDFEFRERRATHTAEKGCELLLNCICSAAGKFSAMTDADQERWAARSLNSLAESLGGNHELSQLFRKRVKSYKAFDASKQSQLIELEEMLKVLSDAREELLIKAGTKPTSSTRHQAGDGKAVFIVHGRDESMRKAMFDFLRSIGLRPLEWSTMVSKTKSGTPFIGEILDSGMSEAQAVVVLFTPDDLAKLRSDLLFDEDGSYERDLTPQPRPNVLFEAGLAFGRHPETTILVQMGNMRPFSDIAGRHLIHLDNSPQLRHDFVNRLHAVGCRLDTSGKDWISTGDFSLITG
jgi:predicted nucleotide-binding protein